MMMMMMIRRRAMVAGGGGANTRTAGPRGRRGGCLSVATIVQRFDRGLDGRLVRITRGHCDLKRGGRRHQREHHNARDQPASRGSYGGGTSLNH